MSAPIVGPIVLWGGGAIGAHLVRAGQDILFVDKTEADPQLGPIVTIARQYSLDAPITARPLTMIHEIEDGRRAMAWANLDELAREVPA